MHGMHHPSLGREGFLSRAYYEEKRLNNTIAGTSPCERWRPGVGMGTPLNSNFLSGPLSL
jgi:hypothetical protein